jgi:sulfatase modifying factor 1
MRLSRRQIATGNRLIGSKTDSFVELVKISGLDPKTEFIGSDLSGVDFGTDDIAGFVFSRADLRGADFTRARGLRDAKFADVIVDKDTKGLIGVTSTGPSMVAILPGRFEMGIPEKESQRERFSGGLDNNARPQHQVVIRRRFYLSCYPVTRGEYSVFVEETKRERFSIRQRGESWANPGFTQTDRHPVVNVNAFDAMDYTSWLSARTGLAYRLPSEAEWEFAARGGTTTSRYWGNGFGEAHIFAWSGKPRAGAERGTAPVGLRQPNRWGLYDMLGNVSEWTADYVNETYDGAPSDGAPWLTGDSSRRVARGGSWWNSPEEIRAGSRIFASASYRSDYVGFRVAMAL